MVEQEIKKHSAEFKVYQLFNNLPKRVIYLTYKIILDYLLEINKIVINNKGKFVYI